MTGKTTPTTTGNPSHLESLSPPLLEVSLASSSCPHYPHVQALISLQGPLVGGSFPPGQHAPPAIAEQYWDEVCEGRIVSINRDEVHKGIGWMMEPVTKAWVARLAGVDDQCVELSRTDGSIYDWL